MKKIMFFMGGLGDGGAERILLNTIKALPQNKYDLTLILLKNEGVLLKEIPDYVEVKYLIDTHNTKQIKWFYRLFHHIPFKILYRFFIKKSYDIEIAFLEGLPTHIIGCSTNKKSKKIAWVHTDMINNQWANKDYKTEKQHSRIYKNFDHIICVSNYCLSKFIERFGDGYPVMTLPNIIDDEVIRKKANEPCIDFPKKKSFTIISSGRFVRQKGFDRLVRIHNKLIKEGINHELWLLGDGVMKKDIEEYIINNDLVNSIKLYGYQNNPYPFIINSDLFVCSSRSEGYSTVVAEALILGIPIISTNVSGADELLDKGNYGVIVDNNEESLYLAIKSFLNNKDEYNKFKLLAEQRGGMFSKTKRIQELEKLLDEC